MKNSLGNPARGEAFYPRVEEVRKIYKALDSDVSIYLAAPRRVGKTSILKYLEENPKKNFYFIYIITESIYEENEFYKVVFEELIKSSAIKTISKLSQGVFDFIGSILNRVSSIQGVEFREVQEPNYYNLLIELLSKVDSEHGKVIIMIDEFPQTIQNILEKYDKLTSQQFIQSNRELRHQKNFEGKVSFIYTGSVSLVPMVEKITSLTAINDLRTIEVEPLSNSKAKDFFKLLMSEEKIEIDDSSIQYLLKKMGWLIPFHIQLIQQEIVDVHESTGKAIDKKSVDRAFEQVVHTRNKPQFEPYFSRLSKIFKDDDHEFVIDLLKYTAAHDSIGDEVMQDLSVKHSVKDLKFIMNNLIGDGYIFKTGRVYRYTSPILQLWCKKHICE